MKKLALVAIVFGIFLIGVNVPVASAVQVNGGFAIAGAAEWVAGTIGTIVTLDAAGALDFVTPAQATAGQTSPGVAGPMTVTDASGSFVGVLTPGVSTGTIQDFTYDTTKCGGIGCEGGLVQPVPSPASAGGTLVSWEILPGVSVDLVNITLIQKICNTGCPVAGLSNLTLQGNIIVHLAGFEDTPGVFNLSVGTVSSTFSFAAQQGATPTPEPATLLLLGTGLVGAAVVARKRK